MPTRTKFDSLAEDAENDSTGQTSKAKAKKAGKKVPESEWLEEMPLERSKMEGSGVKLQPTGRIRRVAVMKQYI